MDRLILKNLQDWSKEETPKPLLLTGARQVGKSYTIKKLLSPSFENFIEINFDENLDFRASFQGSLDPKFIIPKLEAQTGKDIVPGKTLLFFDEAQNCLECLQSLRYFREKLPKLHVVAAGSLLEFALEKISIPVGRVTLRHLNPLSFEEYLINSEYRNLFKEISSNDFSKKYSKAVHISAIGALKEYLAIGGMPEVVSSFINNKNYNKVQEIQQDILDTYESDIPKYSKKSSEYKYSNIVFKQAPRLVSKVLKYSHISREVKSTYLKQGIDLLVKASLFSICYKSSSAPLNASFNPGRYKLFFLDIGLLQRACNLKISSWIEDDSLQLATSGMLAEQFVAQEILAHSNNRRGKVYYWEREKTNASAELDFLYERNNDIYPIEVKGGAIGTLKSMRWYLDKHKKRTGLRLSLGNVSQHERLLSIPSYAFSTWLKLNS